MTTSVVVPWRSGGCPFRTAAWEHVKASWDGWDLHTADDGGEPFSRAASINLAVSEHPADVYVIADADTLTDKTAVEAAVDLAAWSPGLVVAFDRFAYLSREGTEQVLDGFKGWWDPLIAWTLQDTVSSCVAVSAETWETVGGFDPRFRAWGMDDVQFEVACAALCGETRRLPGTCFHLWHPPERERPAVNAGMLDQYLRLRGDREGMRAHVSKVQREFREGQPQGESAVLPVVQTIREQRSAPTVGGGESSEEPGDQEEVAGREPRADAGDPRRVACSELGEGSGLPAEGEEEEPDLERLVCPSPDGAATRSHDGAVHAGAASVASGVLR